jgi:hypothetical protein
LTLKVGETMVRRAKGAVRTVPLALANVSFRRERQRTKRRAWDIVGRETGR